MVGLPDNAIKESQQRIEAALKFRGYRMPRTKVVVNMAPADIRKEGSAYDLPIALGILHASQQLNTERLGEYIIMGELALDGSLRPIQGVLPIAIQARKEGFKGFILPSENAEEAAIVNNLDVIPVDSMQEAIDFFEGRLDITPLTDRYPRRISAHRQQIHRRLCRRAGPGKHQARPGNSGGRRPQCHHDWPTRRRQNHAGQAPAQYSAAAVACRRRWKPPRSTRWPASSARMLLAELRGHSGRRTTPFRMWRWWAAAATRSRAKSRFRTTACCFWTSCRSLSARCWR